MDNVTVQSDFAGWLVTIRVDRSRETDSPLEAMREASKIVQREVLRNERADTGRNPSR